MAWAALLRCVLRRLLRDDRRALRGSARCVHVTRRAHGRDAAMGVAARRADPRVGGLIVGLLLGRGGELELLGVPISVRGLYTPVLMLTLLVLVRVAILVSAARLEMPAQSSWALKSRRSPALACAGAALAGALRPRSADARDGRFVNPTDLVAQQPARRRSAGVRHPESQSPADRAGGCDGGQRDAPIVFVEYTAVPQPGGAGGDRRRDAAGVVPAAQRLVVRDASGCAARARAVRPSSPASTRTCPAPWALLRYVPIVGLARIADTIRDRRRAGRRGAAGVARSPRSARAGRTAPHAGALASALLLVLRAVAGTAPAVLRRRSRRVYDLIAADPRPVRVLSLPFGVRDGVSSRGNFSARYAVQPDAPRQGADRRLPVARVAAAR